MTKEGLDRNFEWDVTERLVAFYNQAGSAEPSVYTHYLYDMAGNRVKKVSRKSGNRLEVCNYISGGFEHSYVKPSGTTIDTNKNYKIRLKCTTFFLFQSAQRVMSTYKSDKFLSTETYKGDTVSNYQGWVKSTLFGDSSLTDLTPKINYLKNYLPIEWIKQ